MPVAARLTVLNTVWTCVRERIKIPQGAGPSFFVSFSADSRTSYVSV